MHNTIEITKNTVFRGIDEPKDGAQQGYISYCGSDYERTPNTDVYNDKSTKIRTVGIIAGTAAVAASVWAGIHGKNILNKAEMETGFFKNVKTGFKNFFKKTDKAAEDIKKKAEEIAEEAKKAAEEAKKKAAESVDDATKKTTDDIVDKTKKTTDDITNKTNVQTELNKLGAKTIVGATDAEITKYIDSVIPEEYSAMKDIMKTAYKTVQCKGSNSCLLTKGKYKKMQLNQFAGDKFIEAYKAIYGEEFVNKLMKGDSILYKKLDTITMNEILAYIPEQYRNVISALPELCNSEFLSQTLKEAYINQKDVSKLLFNKEFIKGAESITKNWDKTGIQVFAEDLIKVSM